VITKILLKLIPKPAARKTLLAVYERMDEAAATVSAIIAAKIIPCTMEFLDRTTIRCIEEYSHVGLPLDCDAILLLETDGHPAAVDDEAQRMEAIAREHGARSVSLAKDKVDDGSSHGNSRDGPSRSNDYPRGCHGTALKASRDGAIRSKDR
jgi:glycolate oxidase